MKQAQFMTLEHYEQLKQLSDPLRCRIVNLLIPQSYTGQQLSKELEIPRAKIHYHLSELEKNGLIDVAKTEVKNGIIQKFYRAVARTFIPAGHLLPHSVEVGDYLRGMTINALERARIQAITAPERAFTMTNKDHEQWQRVTVQLEKQLTEEQFIAWNKKFRALISELMEIEVPEKEEGRWYYFMATGFENEGTWFDPANTELDTIIDPSEDSEVESVEKTDEEPQS